MSTIKPTTVPSKRLSETIIGTDYTMKVNNIEGWDGSDLVAADFGSVGYAVLRDEGSTVLELVSFDPATIASTSITILKRGLDFTGDLTTEVPANQLTWVKNQTIIEFGAPTPQLFQWLKEYIDAAVVSGGVPATTSVAGISELATQAEVDARSTTGTSGPLVVTPDKVRATKYHDYAADAGASDTYAISVTPAATAYATGDIYVFKANTVNTGTATLNVNSLGAKTITRHDGTTLVDGDIAASEIVTVIYDGTNFRLGKVPNSTDYQAFTANGTWTKPSNTTGNELAIVHAWGAGGGGGNGATNAGGGGGGGSFVQASIRVGLLGATETVTIGAGGTAGNQGGNTTFGSWITAYGGGAGAASVTTTPGAGGGGGGSLALGSSGSGTTGGTGGSPNPGVSGATTGTDSGLGGGGGGAATDNGGATGGASLYSGGGGGGAPVVAGNAGKAGGRSVWGGGGGGSGGNTGGAGGVSTFGGAGGAGGAVGANGTAGSAPGGGGGGGGTTSGLGASGARGEIRVWVIRT